MFIYIEREREREKYIRMKYLFMKYFMILYGVGDFEGIGGTDSKLKEKGHRGVSPYFVPSKCLYIFREKYVKI